MQTSRFESGLARAFLVVSAVAAAMILVETAARLFLRYGASDDQVLRFASVAQLEQSKGVAPRLSPHRFLGFYPTPSYQHRNNRHDRFGFRGEDVALGKPPHVYRIVCLGGSAMYSDGVRDYRQSFPFLLQAYLRETSSTAVEVINAASPGHSSLESLVNLQVRVLELEPDLIVVYHGINDLGARLVWPPSSYRGDQSGSVRVSVRRRDSWLLERSAMVRILLIRLGWMDPLASLRRYLGSPPETSYRQELGRQIAAGTYPSGFFTSVALKTMLSANRPTHFRRNLVNIVTLAEANGAEALLLTFAFSAAGPWQGLVELPEVRTALAEMNEDIRATARRRDALFFDLAAAMPDSSRHYTDGYHFTAEGNLIRARLVGTAVADRLRRP